jgi:hypothetical protein
MRDRPSRPRKGLRRARAACLTAVAACAVSAVAVSSAKAVTEPFSTSFDNAYLNLGGVEVDALDPPDTATMSGQIDPATGDFTIPSATGFDFPQFSGPVLGGLATVTADLTALEDLTGHLEGGASPTGNVTTDPTDFEARIDLTISGLTNHCKIDAPFGFSTLADYPAPYKGDPFDVNLAGTPPLTNGAMVTSWPSLTVLPVTPGVDDCSLVATLTQGPGGIWLAQGLALPTPTSAPPAGSPGGGTITSPPPAPKKKKKCKKGFKKVKVHGKIKCKKKK